LQIQYHVARIEVEHAHPKRETTSGEAAGGRGPANDAEHEATAAPHATAHGLDGAKPAGGDGGRGRRGVAREQVGPAEQAEDERHDGVGDLLGAVGIDVDEAESQVGGHRRVGRAVRGAEAEQQLPGPQPALRGAREEGEGGEQHRGGGLDAARGDGGERHVLHRGHARQHLLLQRWVVEAVERHHQRLLPPAAAGRRRMGHPGWLRFRLGRSDREREAGARAGLWAVAWVLVPDTRRRTGVGALPLLWGEGRGERDCRCPHHRFTRRELQPLDLVAFRGGCARARVSPLVMRCTAVNAQLSSDSDIPYGICGDKSLGCRRAPARRRRARWRKQREMQASKTEMMVELRALTMQDFITESKTINYILFMVFY